MCGHSFHPGARKHRVPGGPGFRRNGRVGFSFLVYTISKNALALMTPMSNLLRRRVPMTGEEWQGRALPIRCHAGSSGQPGIIIRGCYLYRYNSGWFSLRELTFI
jgi:hypothetical protein